MFSCSSSAELLQGKKIEILNLKTFNKNKSQFERERFGWAVKDLNIEIRPWQFIVIRKKGNVVCRNKTLFGMVRFVYRRYVIFKCFVILQLIYWIETHIWLLFWFQIRPIDGRVVAVVRGDLREGDVEARRRRDHLLVTQHRSCRTQV